jgi:hypothetical protein
VAHYAKCQHQLIFFFSSSSSLIGIGRYLNNAGNCGTENRQSGRLGEVQ